MKQPETSIEAKELKTDESKRKDYDKIILALQAIGEGHYERIAGYLSINELSVISRRMKEMRELGMIENTGRKEKTSRNRGAFVHRICTMPKVAVKEPKKPKRKIEPNQKTITVRSYERRIKVKDQPDNQNKLF